MIAASYWSLLKPAIEIATESGQYGPQGEWVFVPVAIGFLFGAVFVFLTDLYLPCCVSFFCFIFNLIEVLFDKNNIPSNFIN